MERQQHYVVVGNGPAGNEAALTLRNKAPDARITLISKERGGSYKPNLLPHLIAGKIDEESIRVFSPSSYKEMDIKFRGGQEIVGLDIERREIILDHKEVIRFDGLILALGGKPCIPADLSLFSDHMLTLKTLQDARTWRNGLEMAEKILVIGGDLTSLAFTKQLLDMNKHVFFLINEDAFWPLRFDLNLFEQVARQLARKGVEVLTYSRIKGMTALPDGKFEIMTDHENVRVDLIGAFFGLIPDIGFLKGSGLKLDRGILVDEYLNSGFEGIYATGDCAQIYHPEIRDYWISIGHDNAVALGRTAALNLAGDKTRAKTDLECVFDVQGVCVNSSWWMEF